MRKRRALLLFVIGIGGCLLMEEPQIPKTSAPHIQTGPVQEWPAPIVIDSIVPDSALADGDTVRIFYRTTHRHQPRPKERD